MTMMELEATLAAKQGITPEAIAASYSKSLPDGLTPTEVGNAVRFSHIARGKALYVTDANEWRIFRNGVWESESGTVFAVGLAKKVADEMEMSCARLTSKAKESAEAWIKASRTESKLRSMVNLSRDIEGMFCRSTDFDSHPHLVNLNNGTYDLAENRFREHDPMDLLSRQMDVDYRDRAQCPRWEETIETIIPDPLERQLLQRWYGYCISGEVSEQIALFAVGNGANGKSTLVDLIARVFGTYAGKIPKNLLVKSRNDSQSTGVVELMGLRFAHTAEMDIDDRLSEASFKEIVGGNDQLKGRQIYRDWVEWWPTHHLQLSSNHPPIVSGTDFGVWRRILLLNFRVEIPEADRDLDLGEKLREEMSGIFNWLLDGYYAWKAEGLNPPESVIADTRQYREESDWFASFMAERNYELNPTLITKSAELLDDGRRWAGTNQTDTPSPKKMAHSLRNNGCTPVRGTGGVKSWKGIGRKAK